jgi:hypothetical protein
VLGSRVRMARRQEFVACYRLPEGLGRDLLSRYPKLASSDLALRGLRQWLGLHVAAPGLLGMPSKGVDLLWHEFILDTVEYERFCRQAYGRTLHHAPERTIDPAAQAEGVARTFAMACRDEGIQLPGMLALPVLFTVDESLQLGDGQHWTLDCGRSTCAASPPVRCIRHAVRPHLPEHLPDQRRPANGKWFIRGGGGLGAAYGVGAGSSAGRSGAGHGGGGHGCAGHGGGHGCGGQGGGGH